MKSDTLVILSLAFQRLIRSHLSPMVLEVLTRRADVIVVSPFADNPDFLKQHTKPGIEHLKCPTEKDISWLARKMAGISSIMRMRGYWFRRRGDIPYYWATRHLQLGENGQDKKRGFFYRVVMDMLAVLGYWPSVWKFFDSLQGRWSYQCPELSALADRYQRVTLIQASAWGFQDAALGYLGRKNQWRTVMLPYSADQLFCNGYLYSDFDVVCVQGEAENRWAREFHQIPAKRVIKLGSVLSRVLRTVAKDIANKDENFREEKKQIMYAGIGTTYFPEDAEIEAVNKLCEFLDAFTGTSHELIYRPVRFETSSISALYSKLKYPDKVVIQIPSSNSLGVDCYRQSDIKSDLLEIVNALASINLLVTSSLTSLILEAASMGVPSISYYPKSNIILKNRKWNLLFNHENKPYILDMVDVALSSDELVSIAAKYLTEKDLRVKAANLVNFLFRIFIKAHLYTKIFIII